MAEWGWVAAGFVVAYGSVGGYLLWLRRRWVAVSRRVGDPRLGGGQ